MNTSSRDYVIRIHHDPSQLDASAWDQLAADCGAAGPFLRHAYLAALHQTGCATPETGWSPHFLSLWEAEQMVAACPLYLKSHSYGEYVFDWAWARAYEQHGLRYFPKLLDAVPFTPVPGPRLLARTTHARAQLLQAIQALMEQSKLSSAHLLFIGDKDCETARETGWMLRSTVQFHWHNRRDMPYEDFTDFLASLSREKRKKIQQERRRVQDQGVDFDIIEGASITEADWDFFHDCYCATYAAHGSSPYLNREFFRRMGDELPEHWVLFIANAHGQRVAASLLAVDRNQRRAFGRYWGCVKHLPFLHFEACYYQPIAWCIAHGYEVFEGGAQGEHKMARGLLPVETWSAHKLAHPAFADAVARFLEREGEGMREYVDELRERSPFKDGPSDAAR